MNALSNVLQFVWSVLFTIASCMFADLAWCQTDQTNGDGATTSFTIYFTDGGMLKTNWPFTKIELATEFGKLVIPTSEIQRIEFGIRVSPELTAEIQQHISKLNSNEFADRENASRGLRALGEKSYPALRQLLIQNDPETRQRAKKLIDEILNSNADARDFDLVYTKRSQIAGQIIPSEFRIRTSQMGEVSLNISDVKRILTPGAMLKANLGDLKPAPRNLHEYHSKHGEVFSFRVTGNLSGSVWGSDPYTTDSTLAKAAVHAGILKDGETGIVQIKIVEPPTKFENSTANGVSSNAYGSFPGAFQFVAGAQR